MKRTTPTRVIETGRMARGSSGQGVGWLQSLGERARNLRAQLQGINERLNTPFANGVPACMNGSLLFKADTTQIVALTNFPSSPDTDPAHFITFNANPIILSGKTYKVPITFTPPGVLMAHNLVVSIEAGFTMFANQPRSGITPLNDYRQVTAATLVPSFVPPPTFGRAMRFTYQQQVLGDFMAVMPFMPYLWNIIDEKSGRQYAQDWMPHGALLNARVNGQGDGATANVTADSELFEFDAPWLFERDAQVSFLFRPLMDLYQVDKGAAVLPYGSDNSGATNGTDDRSGGLRTEQATVHVEFHGNRYYSAQDALKWGAQVTNSEPQRHPYGLNDPISPDNIGGYRGR